MRYVFLSIFLHFFSCLFLGTGSGFERISVPSRLGNSTTATPAGSPEKQPPASPQDQPMDIIYEDFDMPLASTSGSNNHPDPNSPWHEETHTLANPGSWQAVSSEPSTQMEEMDLELDQFGWRSCTDTNSGSWCWEYCHYGPLLWKWCWFLFILLVYYLNYSNLPPGIMLNDELKEIWTVTCPDGAPIPTCDNLSF